MPFALLFSPFNFINCQSPPLIELNHDLLRQFSQISSFAVQFQEGTQDVKIMFSNLKEFIIKEEQEFGPRKFRKMITQLFTFLIEHSIRQIQKANPQYAILTLTYFQRSCQNYLDDNLIAIIHAVYSICNIRMGLHSVASQKIKQCRKVLGMPNTCTDNDLSIKDLCRVIEGIIQCKMERPKKARVIFAEQITSLTSVIKECALKRKAIPKNVANCFVLCTYFLSQAYQQTEQYDLASYHQTILYHFCNKNLQGREAAYLSDMLLRQNCFQVKAKLKLTRLQGKVQEIGIIQKGNLRRTAVSMHSTPIINRNSTEKIPIYKRTFKPEIPPDVIKAQTCDIFVKKSKPPSYFRLKERTLLKLNQEKQKTEAQMHKTVSKIITLTQQTAILKQQYIVQPILSQMDELQRKEKELIQQIQPQKWQVVKQLKSKRIIEQYLSAFIDMCNYSHNYNVFSMLYGGSKMQSHLKMLSFVRKMKNKTRKEYINKINYRGIAHQVELIYHYPTQGKTQPFYSFIIYQTEQNKSGINDEISIDAATFQLLQKEPFWQVFQVVNNKLVTLGQYIQKLGQRLIFIIKKFIYKLKLRVDRRHKRLSYTKRKLSIGYDPLHPIFSLIIFTTTRENMIKHSNYAYKHIIQRIDQTFSPSYLHNLPFFQIVYSNEQRQSDEEISQLVLDAIETERKKDLKGILHIQKVIRKTLAVKRSRDRKKDIDVQSIKINNHLFTLLRKEEGTIFFIEDIYLKNEVLVQKDVSYSSLAFVNKLRGELQKLTNISDQSNLIIKYFKMQDYSQRIFQKSRTIRFFTDFQTQFKKKLCFSKLTNNFIFRGRKMQGKMMYMLTVKEFSQFPRPYLLRVFTIQTKSIVTVDFKQIIYNKQKVYLQNNLNKIQQIIDIQGVSTAEILTTPAQRTPTRLARPSQSSMLSFFTLNSGSEVDIIDSRSNHLRNLTRKMQLGIRPSGRDSIGSKLRHKSALKQKDVIQIRKWIEQNRINGDFDDQSSKSSSERSRDV